MNIHKTAIVDPGAEIGQGTKIWHFCHVSEKSKIGRNCTLGHNVFIGKNVVIGNNVKIQNNVSIFDGCVISSNVFIGPHVVFTNVKHPTSKQKAKKYETTFVRSGVTIGANSTILCDVTLGRNSFIGAHSFINTDTEPGHLYYGVPAKKIKKL